MKAYKGFDKDLKCRDFQFEIGKEYEEKEASLCNSGFHACEYPLDVFGYYGPSDSRFCEVELEATKERQPDDSKVCGKKIKIGAEIGLKGIIDASVKFVMEKADFNNAKATNSGDRSVATNSGDRSVATNSGYSSVATNSGYSSVATNSGYSSVATVTKKDSVAIVTGYQSKAKACKGSAIVVVERGAWDGKTYPLLNIKSAIIDGEILKENTYYTLINNEFVEVE